MKWNWQLPDWPDFTYDASTLHEAEARFLVGSGMLLGAMVKLSQDDTARVHVDLLSDEAFETSRIEGELLSRDSLQSSVRRQFGLPADSRKISPGEQGVAKVMVEVFRRFDDDLTPEMLCHWQRLLMQGKRGLNDVGRFRTTAEPMQIISGSIHEPRVHFEAVPSHQVPQEMDRFLTWFNGSRKTMSALARAAISHAYFESIHPFEDGNGRIGRAIAEMALSQASGKPVLLALSRTISGRKKAYYAELEKVNRTLEVSRWVSFFADTVLEAQRSAGLLLHFILEKAKFFEQFGNTLNDRQEKVLLKLFAAGPNGFEGGLSASNYRSISKASPATVTRDLSELVELGALERTGEKKHTRYRLKLGESPLL
jgi:Fic family protein